jgi:epoxyqueuosine reductase
MEPGLTRAALEDLAREHGFDAVGISGVDLAEDEVHLREWLASDFHGQMHYMQRHGERRSRPATLKPGTLRVISLRMNYWPSRAREAGEVLADTRLGYVSRYALGRDYHRVMRPALARLAESISGRIAPHAYRVYVDTGPVLEKALARNAGLGWIGKHTNLIARDAGSLFFLGEIFTDLPLPPDEPGDMHCGTCTACIPACPTGAILEPFRLDARRCISYLTIELEGDIPEEFRPAIGNRIYGCDDCQLACPWNKFAQQASHPDFRVRHGLDAPRLSDLLGWDAEEFERRMAGSAIFRIGHERFLRNVAVALGNGEPTAEALGALRARATDPSPVVAGHVRWALSRLEARRAGCL